MTSFSWAIVNEHHRGRYQSPLTIAGHQLELTKCEHYFLHTYLVVGGDALEEELLVDMTYQQFLLLPELGATVAHFQVSCDKLRSSWQSNMTS